MSNATIKDAVRAHWTRRLPASWLPYVQLMRLERPTGWWLLLLPCWWGLSLAELSARNGLPDFKSGLLFLVGAIVMRGAGCVVNDLADQDYDARVERTRNRPLPSGRISRKRAYIFLCLLLSIGLAIVLQFNWITIIIASAALAIVAVYPFMKRIIHMPQLVLGLAFNCGALVGWTARTGTLTSAPLVLYLGGISWTLAYDTIYAHQDKDDDAMIGLKSTALLFGKSTVLWLGIFFALSLVLIDLAIWLAQAPLIAHIGVLAAAVHAWWQIKNFDDSNSIRCLRLFRANRDFGLFILVGMIIGCLV